MVLQHWLDEDDYEGVNCPYISSTGGFGKLLGSEE
jgi:hypothetical protein